MEGGCWPTRSQELLLTATLTHGERALSAYREWAETTDIRHLDRGSYRLLPLLFLILQNHQVQDPLMQKLKGAYRQTWYKTQILFRELELVLRSLQQAGIATLLLKGAALVLTCYRQRGLRPMDDFDVLVRTTQAREVVDHLQQWGWRPKTPSLDDLMPFIHGCEFVHPRRKHSLDLHWHVLHEGLRVDDDGDFWGRSIPTYVESVPTYLLCCEDQLLHTCIHGAKWNPGVPPIRWIADASWIVNGTGPAFDWNRVLSQARRRGLVLPLRKTLGYLRDTLDVPIPTGILNRLETAPVSKMQRIEFVYKTTDYSRRPLGYLPILWFDYVRQMADSNLRAKILGFARLLQRHWMVKHPRHLPLVAVRMLIQRIRAVLGWDSRRAGTQTR